MSHSTGDVQKEATVDRSPNQRTWVSLAHFAGCGMLLPTGSQLGKRGDIACDRGPLGAFLCRHLCRQDIL